MKKLDDSLDYILVAALFVYLGLVVLYIFTIIAEP
jgi:hypothetical protein